MKSRGVIVSKMANWSTRSCNKIDVGNSQHMPSSYDDAVIAYRRPPMIRLENLVGADRVGQCTSAFSCQRYNLMY